MWMRSESEELNRELIHSIESQLNYKILDAFGWLNSSFVCDFIFMCFNFHIRRTLSSIPIQRHSILASRDAPDKMEHLSAANSHTIRFTLVYGDENGSSCVVADAAVAR